MSLLISELTYLRTCIGYNAMGLNAEPYVEYHAIFDRVVLQYLQSGALTTSSTTVAAAPLGSGGAQVTLTLASAVGFSPGDRVIVDVDSRQEAATVQNVSGSTITALLSLTHTGSYPVTVEGGESLVREMLKRIRAVQDQLSKPATLIAAGSGGIKRVDEIEFHGVATSGYWQTAFGGLERELMRLRDELASMLGVTNLFRLRSTAGLCTALY